MPAPTVGAAELALAGLVGRPRSTGITAGPPRVIGPEPMRQIEHEPAESGRIGAYRRGDRRESAGG